MLEEMDSLQKNETWDPFSQPPDKNIVGSRWAGLTRENTSKMVFFI